MMEIIAVGKLSTKGYKESFDHYFKQMHKIKITEIKESHIISEAKDIKKILDIDAYKIVLAIEGQSFSSENFTYQLKKLIDQGKKIQFIIGGSEGLDESIKNQAQATISLSLMTFPHQLARIMLIEQLYRSIKIMDNHPYHK